MRIGDRVKINAFVYVCTGVTIEDGVMVGAGTIFTNDRYPRRRRPTCATLRPSEPDEHTLPTLVRRGRDDRRRLRDRLRPRRSAGSRWSAWARWSPARSPAFHLVVGQPARSVAVVSRAGEPLVRFSGARPPDRDEVVCPVSGLRYAIRAGEVIELDPPS